MKPVVCEQTYYDLKKYADQSFTDPAEGSAAELAVLDYADTHEMDGFAEIQEERYFRFSQQKQGRGTRSRVGSRIVSRTTRPRCASTGWLVACSSPAA